MQLIDAIKKRREVKRYSLKKPDWRKVIRAIDTARYSPNAGGQFVIRYVVIQDEEKIKKLKDATQQSFVGDAKIIVVAVSDDSKLEKFYKDRATRYSSLQAGASIQNFLLNLTEQGLVTKWVKYFVDDQVKFILEIPDKLQVEGIFPIGLPTPHRVEEEYVMPLDNVIYFDKWKQKEMEPRTKVRERNI